MTLGSTQPLTEMSTGGFLGGKGGRCVRLKTLPPSCAVVMKFGNLNSWNPLGYFRPVMGLIFTDYELQLFFLRSCYSLSFRCNHSLQPTLSRHPNTVFYF